MARTIFVDPTAQAGGDGSVQRPYRAWSDVAFAAGDIALQRGGTTAAGFAIGPGIGPVMIGSYGGGRARIEGTVALSGTEGVVLGNLEIAGGEGAGIVLSEGAAGTVVQQCDIHGGMAGILLSGGAQSGTVIVGNLIHDNDTTGIGIDGAGGTEATPVLIAGNTIYRNGQQGVLLHGSHVAVDGNLVVNNGLSGLPGISAVHVIATDLDDPWGRYNSISGNVIAWQRDGSSVDGNGLQLDHWSSDSSVTGNQVFGNDGAGISLFTARDSVVRDNVVFENMADAGGTHVIQRAEIFVGDSDGTDGYGSGNLVTGNIAFATSPHGVAIQVNEHLNAAGNEIAGNLLARSGPGALWRAGDLAGTSLDDWNALLPNGDDQAFAGPAPAAPALPAAMLDRALQLHSSLFRTVNPDGPSQLVAHGDAKDVTGGEQGGWMAGDGRDNLLVARGGINQIASGGGNATLRGADGMDLLFGGAGDVALYGGDGDDTLVGGAGNSRLFGEAGNDRLYAGNGSGTMRLDGGPGIDLLFGGPSTDTFVLGADSDVVYGFTPGQDLLDVASSGARGLTDLLLVPAGADTLLADSAGGMLAQLVGVDAASLTARDFVFAPSTKVAIAPATASLGEGHSGATPFTFLVTRSGDLASFLGLKWAVGPGSIAGTVSASAADFVGGALPGGSIVFLPGESSRTISVNVQGDSKQELNESFALTLSGATSPVEMAVPTASAVIWDDDKPGTGTLSIARLSAWKPEGDSGVTPFTFTVTRGGDTSGQAGATWRLTGGGVAGTVAPNDRDFASAVRGGWVGFAAGQTQRTITIGVAGDTEREGGLNESFTITLSQPLAGTTLGTASATGVIFNDDPAPLPALAETVTASAPVQVVVAAGPAPLVRPYSGTDPELIWEVAALGPEGVTVAGARPGLVLRGGEGDDALAAFGGRNVLDGGGGSNFLAGAAGRDSFVADLRAGPGWSTIAGFGAGDDATLAGLAGPGVSLAWHDGLGAASHTGLTLVASFAQHQAAVTLAGYALSDLASGRLSVAAEEESLVLRAL